MSGSLLSRAALPLVAVAAALLGAGTTWLVSRNTSGDEIRAYLLAHPEVLPEAMDVLNRREMAKTISASRDDIVKPFGTAWAGNPNGDVEVVEYLDYNCGYCRASLPTVDALIAADPKVKVVYREWPVLSQESLIAARYGLALARLGGDYRKFHAAAYAAHPLTEQGIEDAVRAAGADPAEVKKAISAPEIDGAIVTNGQLMRALGQTGTPSWIIGDKVVSSALPLEELQKAVAAARAKG